MNDTVVFGKGYIDVEDLHNISGTGRSLIMKVWIKCKNKNTKKEYYVRPPPANMNNNFQQKVRFELLKIACKYQPETFEEKLMRELKINA